MEASTQRRLVGLKEKVPDIQNTLDMVRFLETRKVGHLPPEPLVQQSRLRLVHMVTVARTVTRRLTNVAQSQNPIPSRLPLS